MENENVKLGVAKFNEYEAKITALEVYKNLTIAGIEDKEGAKIVKAARIECKNIRVQIEKDRKEIKQPFLDACKTIDANAKIFSTNVEAVENHLKNEEQKIADELARIAKEEADRKAKKIYDRIEKINSLDCLFTGFSYIVGGVEIMQIDVENLPDEDFNAKFEELKIISDQLKIEAKIKAEAEAKAAEELRIKEAEAAKRLVELEKREQEIREREAAIKATEEAEKRAEERLKAQKEQAEAAAKAAAEKAEADKLAAIEKAKAEAKALQEAKEAEAKAAAEKAKKEAEKAPDKEKLHALSDAIGAIHIPEMTSEEGKEAIVKVRDQMAKMTNWLYSVATKL